MLFNLFSFIEMILRLMRLWDQFAEYVVTMRQQEIDRKQRELEKAVDATEKIKTAEDAYNAQKDIVDNLP